MTRVLHVLEALEGGTARHVVDICRHVPDVDHEVVVPPRRAGGVTDERAIGAMQDTGARVHLVDMRRSPIRPENGLALATIRRLIFESRPDIIHGHSSVGAALARLAAWHRPVRVVYSPNGIMTGRPVLAVERFLGRRTDRFVAVSESEGELALALGLVPAARLVVIPNGIELETVAPPPGPGLRERLGLAADTPLVGCVARLVPQKAPEDVVRTWALVGRRHPDAHFVLIGAGPLQRLVDQEVAASGLGERFHQLHSLPGAGGLLHELDVFVLPSRFEGGPYTPLEAMRAGVPIVVSDAVGNRDTVEQGVSGLVAPIGDIARLADCVTELLDSPARREALADAARVRLKERFDVATMGASLSALYAELASR